MIGKLPRKNGAVCSFRATTRRHAALLGALLWAGFLQGACDNGDSSGAAEGSITKPTCNVKEDCLGPASNYVCFLGHCEVDFLPCKHPCPFQQACVHSGVIAHCDGCTSDSACLQTEVCQLITGHPCISDTADASVDHDAR